MYSRVVKVLSFAIKKSRAWAQSRQRRLWWSLSYILSRINHNLFLFDFIILSHCVLIRQSKAERDFVQEKLRWASELNFLLVTELAIISQFITQLWNELFIAVHFLFTNKKNLNSNWCRLKMLPPPSRKHDSEFIEKVLT